MEVLQLYRKSWHPMFSSGYTWVARAQMCQSGLAWARFGQWFWAVPNGGFPHSHSRFRPDDYVLRKVVVVGLLAIGARELLRVVAKVDRNAHGAGRILTQFAHH